jgi:hypothetical protein
VVCSRARAAGSTFHRHHPARDQFPQFPRRSSQERRDRLRAGLDPILDRGADMADLPGGATRLLARDYKGKKADRLVTVATPVWFGWSPNCAPTSDCLLGIGAVEDPRRGAQGDQRLVEGWRWRNRGGGRPGGADVASASTGYALW